MATIKQAITDTIERGIYISKFLIVLQLKDLSALIDTNKLIEI